MLNSIWMNKRLKVLHAYFNDIKVNTHAFNLLILGLWYFKDTKSLFIQFSMCTALLLLNGLFVCLCFVFVFCFLWVFFLGGGLFCLVVLIYCKIIQNMYNVFRVFFAVVDGLPDEELESPWRDSPEWSSQVGHCLFSSINDPVTQLLQ